MNEKALSIDAIVARLNALKKYDQGAAHAEADDLLLDALLLFKGGYDVVSAYQAARERVGFWYA